jgi:iron complex transport system substrate-binding protein
MPRLVILLFVLWSAHSAAKEPLRIVAAGASVTEILFALDRGEAVIATDSTSYYPQSAARLTKLGYFRQLSTEGVLAQNPTHLLGAGATGPDDALAQIQTAGVTVIKYDQPSTIDGLLDMINAIGKDVDAREQAAALIESVKSSVNEILTSPEASSVKGKRALYVIANNDRGLTVAGHKTLPDALFTALNMQNIAADLNEYKLMSNESVMQANPEVIFMASHHGADQSAITALCQHPAIAMTQAAKQCNIMPLSSATSLGLSPRIAQTLAAIVTAASASEQLTGE